FNAEDFLEQCLDSVLAQTFCEFEVICIDDSSTDDSESIISDYMKKDSRFVKLSNSENQGAGRTRNEGINSARGEYVMF
ncbi:MAG: glycosyltransferase family A protein, partial [Raoultibacter sp.]